MNGWELTGVIVACTFAFCGFVLPVMRLLWAWVHIWEDRSAEALERSKARERNSRRGFDS